jgi:NADH-quinone oxidoreductase subunit M
MQAPNLLTLLLFTPLIGMLFIFLTPSEKASRGLAILTGWVMLLESAMMAAQMNWFDMRLQFVNKVTWFASPFPVEYHVGVDGLSLCLLLLTTVVTLISIYASESVKERHRLYYSMVMLLTFSILGVFVSQDLLQFFVMYEFELVPMYFLIAIWGGPNRDFAAMKFLLYTFFGGVLMLGGLLFLFFSLEAQKLGLPTFDMVVLAERAPSLPKGAQLIAFLGFFLAFIIKLPSFPFHTWLPLAHVEAPTPISMILAGLLLKMGGYGLVRICMGFFPNMFIDHGQLIMYLGAFNIVWAAVACLCQTDMKKIIAYSSVSHMGFVLLGLGSLSAGAVSGAIFQMISHGIISAALFFLVGTIYERCHTRQLPEIGGGLAFELPSLFYFWMLAAMANLGLPGLSGFVAEATVFYGSFTSWMAQSSPHAAHVQFAICFAAVGVILTAGYMLWLMKRLFYGPIQDKWKGHLTDAKPWHTEQWLAYTMSFMILAMGIWPTMVTEKYAGVSERLVTNISSRLNLSMRAPDAKERTRTEIY